MPAVVLPKISKLPSRDKCDSSNLKRKRPYKQTDDQSLYLSTINNTKETLTDQSLSFTSPSSASSSVKRVKIYGRKPIKRMQTKLQ